ncbi:hypothetical protein [Nocardia noduli]|uniref:hypothetical protein n=1 Tax=Nocardia noduli TaxID=2815722 RepID=UPI001C23E649|nr:hypothetical protein [Nocardia noduli]
MTNDNDLEFWNLVGVEPEPSATGLWQVKFHASDSPAVGIDDDDPVAGWAEAAIRLDDDLIIPEPVTDFDGEAVALAEVHEIALRRRVMALVERSSIGGQAVGVSTVDLDGGAVAEVHEIAATTDVTEQDAIMWAEAVNQHLAAGATTPLQHLAPVRPLPTVPRLSGAPDYITTPKRFSAAIARVRDLHNLYRLGPSASDHEAIMWPDIVSPHRTDESTSPPPDHLIAPRPFLTSLGCTPPGGLKRDRDSALAAMLRVSSASPPIEARLRAFIEACYPGAEDRSQWSRNADLVCVRPGIVLVLAGALGYTSEEWPWREIDFESILPGLSRTAATACRRIREVAWMREAHPREPIGINKTGSRGPALTPEEVAELVAVRR